MRVRHFVCLIGFAALPSAAAQAQCALTMDQAQCQSAVEQQLRSEGYAISQPAEEQLSEIVIRNSGDLLDRFNTGLSAALAGGELTTFEDFIPWFNVFATGGDGEEAEAVVVELNDFLRLPIDDGYRLTLQLRQPEPFQPLLDAIPEAERANLKDRFEQELSDFDDLQVSFTYSPMSDRIGRSDHQFFSDIFTAALADAQSSLDNKASRASADADARYSYALGQIEDVLYLEEDGLQAKFFDQTVEMGSRSGGACADLLDGDVLQVLRSDDFVSLTGAQLTCAMIGANAVRNGSDVPGLELATLGQTPEGKLVQGYLDAYAEQTSAEFSAMQAELNALKSSNFYSIVDLINNQPQFIVSVDWRDRDPLAGQDQINAKLSYEHGFVNINGLRSHCQGDSMAACLDSYLDDKARMASLERGDRLLFSVEYSKKQSYNYFVDSTMTMLDLPSEESWMASLGYGRYLKFQSDDRGQTRFELSASYEDVDGDTMRQDRLFATATFSQQITDGAALSLSFVYSNKPEFRGDVGTELSARLGVNYKLFKPKDNN